MASASALEITTAIGKPSDTDEEEQKLEKAVRRRLVVPGIKWNSGDDVDHDQNQQEKNSEPIVSKMHRLSMNEKPFCAASGSKTAPLSGHFAVLRRFQRSWSPIAAPPAPTFRWTRIGGKVQQNEEFLAQYFARMDRAHALGCLVHPASSEALRNTLAVRAYSTIHASSPRSVTS